MAEDFMSELEKNGADVKNTLDRFMGKQELYVKFLNKYADSTECQGLIDSIEKGDYEEAFKFAHTLKGVAGNLGLIPIQDLSSDITELLRGKEEPEIDKEALGEKERQLKEKNEVFLALIRDNQ